VGRTGPVWRVGTVGEGRRWGKGVGGKIMCKYCVHMYVNGKMMPVKLFQEWGERKIKENDGGGEFKYSILIYCKNICKCHNVPPPSTTIKKDYIQQTYSQHYIEWGKTETISSKIRNETKMFIVYTFIQYST
jgi:hypothetical protein